ncbi:DUF3626 domain-containing protein [uncultured Nocardioides sp.]|uniref:DUF3626 domain-containing protein n=1 Tax=uncultured Nocardioides sp. TaxID=198441 RepID=UPI00261D3C9B|nr:DUF3626 domain-containing protein [uncultured Nocardioides sp.]
MRDRSSGPLPGARRVHAITLHFHPDWPSQRGTVVDSMVADDRYLSQFVTGSSNGGLTAVQGGDRWLWESRLFEGRYDDRSARSRPVYGAWNRTESPYGASPRFGSAYIRLRSGLIDRSTFCYPDSAHGPERVVDATKLKELTREADEEADRGRIDALDDYVEAHVHGPVMFSVDVAAVVLDPCYAGSPIETAAHRLGCPIEFHPGFRVSADDLDEAYRGPEAVALAHSLGGDLTPLTLGEAARRDDVAPRTLKHLWHYLARFGRAPHTHEGRATDEPTAD